MTPSSQNLRCMSSSSFEVILPNSFACHFFINVLKTLYYMSIHKWYYRIWTGDCIIQIQDDIDLRKIKNYPQRTLSGGNEPSYAHSSFPFSLSFIYKLLVAISITYILIKYCYLG